MPPANADPDLTKNWSLVRSFSGEDQLIGETKHFADGLGRGTQAQVKSLSQGHVLATQTVYSSDGKPVLSTLAAPTFNQEFKFKNGFLQPASSTTDYNYANFETDPNSPSAVAATSKGTVGYYYGPANELEPQTATTQYPFSLQQEYSGPLGGVKRSAGPGDAFRIGSGHELRSRSFPLLNELEHYLSLRPHFVDATSATTALYNHGVKQVSVNPDGIESIAFADQDGKLLASCLSGKDYPGLTLRFALDANTQNTNGLPPYQDIHIPAAGDAVVTVGGTGSIQIIDLVTEAVTTYPTGTATALPASISLVPGFYRVVSISGQQQLSYLAHYGDFSYSYYDNAGRGVASVASRGVVLASTAYPSFVTRNTYSGAGTLLSTESTDEGRTEYVYARDGRIRFSQSAVQHDKGRFSYSNYDELGRVVESGEYTMSADGLAGFVFESQLTETPRTNSVLTLLEDRTRTGGLDVGRCQQRNEIWYDLADETLAGPAQEFVLGAVAKTRNETNVTWYSYDELGRITRMVQQAGGLGKKTVEYTYDFTGNVLKVAYQKEQPDAFYHYYEYDKDQRLNRVYTSRNDLTRTLQAQYYYYLHGSLKRVELAGRLQGIDYAYTVQGWLKSINNVEKRLDPGQDNLKANGVLKDLFGLRLDYFNGDYSSRQLTAPNLATPANSSNIRYDGTVRASTWQTAAAPTIHGYTYAYDAKGQLLQSTYGQLAANTLSQLPQFAEGNLSYDAHGNIERLVRTNDKGTVSDNFKYQYLAGTNKLQAVNTPEGAKVLSYDYDLNGQMKWEAEEGKGTKYMRYDVTGKVSGVYRNADLTNPIATYAYDDRGFRNSKVAYNASGVVQNTTYYVTDAAGNVLSVYEQAPGKELQLAEIPLYGSSRLGTITRLDDEAGTLEPRYELNDQLGNARVVFRKPTSTKYLATVNANLATEEEKDFENLPATRYADIARAYDGAHVAALFTPGQGPKKTLTVEKGDTITFSAQALYYSPTGGRASATASNGLRIMPLITSGATLAPLPGQSTTPGTERSSTKPSFLSRLSFGISLTMFGGKEQPLPNSTTGAPEILIRYRFYNSNNELKAQGVEPFSGSPEAWQKLELGFRAPEAGRIELTTENIGLDYTCYFDHIEVDHTNSTIVQEQHQYAFGSPLTGLNYVVGNKRYRHGYQGQYAEQDEETGYDSFELRLYNSRIGRWTAPDPYGQFFSPYVGMGNDPINSVDTNGGFSGPGDPSHIVGNLLGEVHVTHYASMAPNIVSAMQGSVSAWMATQPPTTLPAYVTAPTSGWAPGTWPPRPAGMSPDGIEPVFWEHNFMPGPPIGRLAERGLSLGVAALERAALRRASRALVPMAEETFEQALFKGVEYIGKVEVYGTKGLVGETFNRNIFYLKSAQPSFGGVRSLLGAMEKEAVEAGAKKISIYGASVINSKIINPKLAAALGYTLEESGQGVILQKVLKP
ncbi:RHS repeat-associated protein [Hymenobacter chitinivorans DSM 11115]|uniref:RHS repeat-associated protein n=2 Tax=Hymenobacter chitinivorans TaxID=89969 RepID=A0A2M9BNQ2_9BACT|nr:RHS repeat-associated protein [Hymenobacter chitinivorans DSM 11115]